MKRKSWHLPRRTFLRGVGASLSLPFLECMGDKLKKTPHPKRFCAIYFPYGVSLPRRKKGNENPESKWQWFPNTEGRNFQFNESLKSLEPLRKHLSILGGLSHPNGRKSADTTLPTSF